MYGEPPRFKELDWPLTILKMAHPQVAHQIMFGFFEACKVPVICHIINAIDKGIAKNRNYMQFAFDLVEVTFRLFHHTRSVVDPNKETSKTTKFDGRFSEAIAKDIKKYIIPQP